MRQLCNTYYAARVEFLDTQQRQRHDAELTATPEPVRAAPARSRGGRAPATDGALHVPSGVASVMAAFGKQR